MSIYTITLKRELLGAGESWADAASLPREPRAESHKHQANQQLANEGGRLVSPEFGTDSIDESSSTQEALLHRRSFSAAGVASGQAKEEAAKLVKKPASDREEQLNTTALKDATQQQQQLLLPQKPLQSPFKHSVNVTLEIRADLKEPSRIVWLRNNQQLTSSEQPILFVKRNNNSVEASTSTTTSQETTHLTQVSAERRLAGVHQQQQQQQLKSVDTGEVCEVFEKRIEEQVVERKCVQEADKKGSRLTIFDIQDQDYGQYTCKLIGADGGELEVQTQLRLEDKTAVSCEEEEERARREGGGREEEEERSGREVERGRKLEVRAPKMDEVIEVKEGDLNIEMGIQVLPEMNEDDGQELMSEEEKREFIAGTTVSWFKDDEKLNPNDAQVLKLFQFSYDPDEAFHKLVVRRATKETEGVYTCVVENESGTSSCCTQLVVGPGNKPKLGSRLEDMTVYAGQSLEFRLKSTGSNRIDSCQWFRDDVLLEGANTGRSELADGTLVFSLRLENIRLDDSGRYKCRVSNEYGYDETECTVRVLQEVIEEHEMVEEHVTESTHIESQTATGKRKSSMEEFVEETDSMKVDESSTVSSGKKPRFLIPLEDTEAYLGETIVMRVALDESVQIDNLRFLKDDSLVYTSRRDETTDRRIKVRTYTETIQTHVDYEQLEEQEEQEHWKRRASNRLARFYEITIEKVREESIGTWSCEAENSFGKATCKAEVDVFAEPRIVRDLDEKLRSSPGTEIRLTVDATGSPRPVYSWFKDGIGIAEEEERLFTQTRDKRSTTTTSTTRRRSSTLEESLQSVTGETLVIRNATPEDAGVYTCKVENRLGQVCSRKCRLTVIGHGDDLNSAPRIIKDFSTDQVIQVDEEENITLRILAEGHPKPSQVWYKDTEEIVERTTRFETETSGQEYQLKISRSKASDSGRYQVLLRNEYGETKSKTVEVRVNKVSPETESQRRPSAPTIQLDSQDKVVGLKSNVSFDVQVGGHPKPFVTWYKNGRRMTESGDGRISFVEEETITTIVEEEIDRYTGEVRESVRKESSTIHRLVINDVREVDEAIYSLKAENDLGSCKSSLVSLTIDRRKEATDEIREREEQEQNNKRKVEESVVEETTVTTTTTTKTTDEREDEELESERYHQKRSNLVRRTSEISDDEEEDGKKRSTKRTTRTTTKTTTTTTQEEEEEADEARLRRKRLEEEEEEEEEKSNKRRTVVEEIEDEIEEDQLIERKNIRREEVVEEQEVEEETKSRTEVIEQMEVDEEEGQRMDEEKRRSRTQSSKKSSERVKELERRQETETLEKRRRLEEEEEEEKTKSRRIREEEEEVVQKRDRKPRILSAPKKVEAGLGSSPELEVIVETTTVVEEEEETITWLKNDNPIADRIFRERHVELISEDGSTTGTRRHILKINNLRSSDAGKYKLRVSNKNGEVETDEIELEVERSMRPGQRPSITPADCRPNIQPTIRSIPEEVVAGMGSSPQVVAEVSGVPEPKLSWFKDGQPVEPRPGTHIEVVDLPTDKPDTVRQALKINNVKPLDAAAYHVKAENPAGEVESEPTNLRIDRSMGPREEPIVTMPVETSPMDVTEEVPDEPKKQSIGKAPRLPLEERILDAPMGSQATMSMPILGKFDKAEWLKDGKPIDDSDKDLVVEQTPDGNQKLHFSDLKPTDAGDYTVRASNEFGTAESAPIRILPAVPKILSQQKEVKVGVGANPVLEVTVESVPDAKIEWLKDGEPLPSRLLSSGHIQPIVEKTDHPGVLKQLLKIDDARPSDASNYILKALNPAGETVSEPIKLVVDKSMGSRDQPIIEKVHSPLDHPSRDTTESSPLEKVGTLGIGPCIVSLPDEIVVGPKSNAVIVAEITGNPLPEIIWHKDGQPITARQLKDGHLVIENLPTDKPDTVKQALKIINVKPLDVAAYHVVAENPSGEAVSHLTNLRIDDSMGPHEEPIQTISDGLSDNTATHSPVARLAPRIVSFPREIVTGPGSNVSIVAEVSGLPLPEISWHKDGKLLTPRQLKDGHLLIENLPSDKSDTVRQVLKIDNVKPQDTASYHIKAQNIAGEDVSQPTNLIVDCNKGPLEEPLQTSNDDVEGPKTKAELQRKRRAPVIIRMPRQVVAAPESTATIVVEVSGVPVPEIIWYRNGKPISKRQLTDGHFVIENLPSDKPDTVKQVLKIVGVKPEDAAAYHVKAENPAGEVVSEPTNLVVDTTLHSSDKQQVDGDSEPTEESKKKKMRAPVIKRLPRRIVAGLGSSPTIEVEVTGEPKPEIIWFKNGRRLREVTNHITFEDCDNGVYRLSFIDVKMTDQAEYTFIARNDLGEIESEPIHLVVDRGLGKDSEPMVQMNTDVPIGDENGPPTAPKIIGLDQDKEAMVGETVKLEAEVVGNPKPDIRWLKDGDEVELNIINEVPDSNVHSLTLKNVNDIYDGVYSLEASNPLGVARKDAKLRVKQPTEITPVEQQPSTQIKEKPQEKPFIKKGLKFSQVNQGRSIKFEVQIDGDYDEVVWMKDGQQINLVEMSEEKEEIEEIEEIEEVSEEISTDATRTSGKPEAKRGFAPKIIRRPRNIVAGPGSRIAFEVRCTGEPKPEIRWYRNGELIKVSTSFDQQEGKVTFEDLDDGQLLIIEDLCETDVGSYHVVVENVYGSEITEPVHLQVESSMPASDDLANTSATLPEETDSKPRTGRRPRFLIRPKAVSAPKGSTIVLECQVTGEPKPVVNWFRDGRIITTSSDGHLRIEEFSDGVVRLVLSDISEQDVGLYHVEAENKLGSERTIPVTLEVQPDGEPVFMTAETNQMDETKRMPQGGRPPRIVLRPRQVLVRPGATIELEVCVSGHSKPELIWYKNKQQVHTSSTTSEHITIEEQVNRGTVSYQKLVIRDAQTKDAGQYTVSACNDFGMAYGEPVEVIVSESCTEDVKDVETSTVSETTEETTTTTTTTTTNTVFYEKYVNDGTDDSEAAKKRRAPNFRLVPRNKKAPVGGTVTLECQVSGVPKPEVIWYKNGRRIHEQADGRVRVEEFSDGGSRLVLEQLEEADDAQYTCEAINKWGRTRSDEVHLRVVEKREVSKFTETSQRGSAKVTTKTTKTRSHYTFSEEKHHSGRWETLTLKDAQLEHDGDYKLIVRNKWGEASTQAPLVVIPQVEPRHRPLAGARERSDSGQSASLPERGSRRTPIEELEDYGHDLDKQIGTFGSESHYQSGEDTYLLQLRDTEFPLRLRKYLRFGANQSASLRSSLMDAHWGAGARVTVRERRRFQEIMDEEIDDEKRDEAMRPMRIQREVGTCGYAAAQLEHLRLEAAERQARKSAEPSSKVDMMPPFFREKIKDAVVEESSAERSQVAVFSCLAVGEPAPEYTWFRNDIVITDWQRLQIVPRPDGGSELHITNPRLNDAACFKCVARNVHGNVTCRARLRIGAIPSRPEPPEYVSVGARELFLEWRAPRDFDASAPEVLGYKLEMSCSSIGESDNWQVIAADVGHQYYLVDDLQPGTSYSFRISARNKFGWSDTYSTYVTTARPTEEPEQSRISVPFVVRERQCTADIVDGHLLRYCEDDKQPQLDYQIEQSPVHLETQASWEDQYKLQAEIARGRFSVVAKAAHKSTGQQVALKAVLSSEMNKAQTKNEFDILRSLQHEKIAKLEVAYKSEQVFVFIMERLAGLDVLSYLSSFTYYNEETVSRIIVQVMDAIEYLHFRGMCLLELQPDNVVMRDGRSTCVKLVDFSSARFVPRSGARVPINASQSVEYCPPEVIANHEVSTASDVWCIGVLTYVMLSGFSPFSGETEEETRENVRLGRYKYDHLYGNCTPEVTRFLINVFKKHSSSRPTIEQLYENKWLLPNDFMIRKRQHATFRTDKIVAFAEQFHRLKKSLAGGSEQVSQHLSGSS